MLKRKRKKKLVNRAPIATFTNYKKADWTQFTEDTEFAFAQTTMPTYLHPAIIIFTNVILMAVKPNTLRIVSPNNSQIHNTPDKQIH